MAFLQETPRSLRAYLLLVGALGTVGQIYQVVLSSEGGPFTRLLGLIGLVISVAYIWVGISFRSLLSAAPRRIQQLLIAGAAYSILLGVVVGVLSPKAEERGNALAQVSWDCWSLSTYSGTYAAWLAKRRDPTPPRPRRDD